MIQLGDYAFSIFHETRDTSVLERPQQLEQYIQKAKELAQQVDPKDNTTYINQHADSFAFHILAIEHLTGRHPYSLQADALAQSVKRDGLHGTSYQSLCFLLCYLDYEQTLAERSWEDEYVRIHHDMLLNGEPIEAVSTRYWQHERDRRRKERLEITCLVIALIGILSVGVLIVRWLLNIFG